MTREYQCYWCGQTFPGGATTVFKRPEGVWKPLCDSCASDPIHEDDKLKTEKELKERSRREYESDS